MKDENLRQKILEEIKRIAKEHNLESVSQSIFQKESSLNISHIARNFDSWTEAVTLAGLKPDTSRKKKTDEELWEELLRVCSKLDKIPGRLEFERESTNSGDIYRSRFGKWELVLSKFKDWLIVKDPTSKFIELIPDIDTINKNIIIKPLTPSDLRDWVWSTAKTPDNLYGPPIDFRGLRHEPINEQGVVFLFGKISEEIGFTIEAIRTAYPDCEGKRLVNRNKNLWEKVYIEFEYNSKSFLEHGHDPSKCDVVICWSHDWADCPLEVIELKVIIKKLRKNN